MKLNWKELGKKYGFDESKINDKFKEKYNSKYDIGDIVYINWLDEDEEKDIYWYHKKPENWMIGEYEGKGKNKIKKKIKVKIIGNWCEKSFDKEFVKKENYFVPVVEIYAFNGKELGSKDGKNEKIVLPMPVNVELYQVESVDEINEAMIDYEGKEFDGEYQAIDCRYHAIGWVDGLYFEKIEE